MTPYDVNIIIKYTGFLPVLLPSHEGTVIKYTSELKITRPRIRSEHSHTYFKTWIVIALW